MLEPMPRETLCDQVLNRLQRYIVERDLGPGDLLPTERDLAVDLGVSRSTLREALGRMEMIGALARRPKRGSVLCPVDLGPVAGLAQVLLLRSPSDLADLFTARRVLEVSVLPLAALKATEEHFRRMDDANRWMEREIAAGMISVEGDAAFHRALLDATGNQFLAQFGALLQRFFQGIRTRLLADERESLRAVEEHRAIADALRDGDAALAGRVMETHLDAYLRRGVVAVDGCSAEEA